jgi:hypothetical protein
MCYKCGCLGLGAPYGGSDPYNHNATTAANYQDMTPLLALESLKDQSNLGTTGHRKAKISSMPC